MPASRGEAGAQFGRAEIAADEDQFGVTGLIRSPALSVIAFHQHVHGLEDEPLGAALYIQNTFRAQDVLSLRPQQRADPSIELVDVDRTLLPQRNAGDRVIMLMVVFSKEVGLDRENAIEIEGALVEQLVDWNEAAFGAMDHGSWIERANARLYLGELVGRNEIDLVDEDRIGEGNLLRRLMAVLQPSGKVLSVDDRDDAVELCFRTDFLVDKKVCATGAGSARPVVSIRMPSS